MAPIAFALREDYAGTTTQEIDGEPVEVPVFTGGLIVAGDRDLDVRQALDDTEDGPAGFIVIDDSDAAALTALEEYPALKRVPVPAGAIAHNPFRDRSARENRETAAQLGIKIATGVKADALADGLLEQANRAAAGDQAVQPSDINEVTITPEGLTTSADAEAPAPVDDPPAADVTPADDDVTPPAGADDASGDDATPGA